MAATTGAHVLRETVAPDPEEDRPSSGAGRWQAHGDPDGRQQQEHEGNRVRHVHEPPSADPHAGWCGEGRLEAGPYPIRRPTCHLMTDCNFSSTPNISETKFVAESKPSDETNSRNFRIFLLRSSCATIAVPTGLGTRSP